MQACGGLVLFHVLGCQGGRLSCAVTALCGVGWKCSPARHPHSPAVLGCSCAPLLAKGLAVWGAPIAGSRAWLGEDENVVREVVLGARPRRVFVFIFVFSFVQKGEEIPLRAPLRFYVS